MSAAKLRRSRLAVVLGCAAAWSPCATATAAPLAATSTNWAGYAVAQGDVHFRAVSGQWTAPRVACVSRAPRSSAVWVGLGGTSRMSPSLAQIGTEADCVDGVARYGAWYELVPKAPRPVTTAVHPGDRLSASVHALHGRVTLRLADLTTRRSFATILRVPRLDRGSAEWIVEAPSRCVDATRCVVMSLADFGTTTITHAHATTTRGHTGPIADPDWTVFGLTLRPSGRGLGQAASSRARAVPDPLGPTGDAFAVSYVAS